MQEGNEALAGSPEAGRAAALLAQATGPQTGGNRSAPSGHQTPGQHVHSLGMRLEQAARPGPPLWRAQARPALPPVLPPLSRLPLPAARGHLLPRATLQPPPTQPPSRSMPVVPQPAAVRAAALAAGAKVFSIARGLDSVEKVICMSYLVHCLQIFSCWQIYEMDVAR